MASDPEPIGEAVSIDGHRVLLGSCSWADKTLVQDADWYPRRTMSAEERLRYYASQFPLIEITTPDLFVVRFHGRSEDTWNARTATAAERFRYLYSKDELAVLAPQVAQAAAQAGETHLLMNNCYRDYSVRNAAELRDLLSADAGRTVSI